MKNVIEYIKKYKVSLIVLLVVWALAEIFIIAPIAYTAGQSTVNGTFNLTLFIENIIPNVASMSSITKVFTSSAFSTFQLGTAILTIVLIVCFGIGIYKARSKSEFEKIEHGSSDWSQNGEQYRVLSKNKGLILAKDNYLPLNKIGNVNVLLVGGSGSGKSSAYSIPNAHQCLGSYVFTDPKGEIYDRTAGYLKSQGYDIKILNLVNPKNSDSYNPLFHIQSEIDVDVIASTIVHGQQSEKASDPYWDNMSELLLKALIYYLLATRPMEEQNLESCAELVRAANTNGGDSNLLSDLINKLPYDHPARMNYKSVEIASDRTYQSILSSLQSALGKFDSKEIADVTSTNTINFEDIATRKTALYVVSSDTHAAYDFLLTIFFSQMIQHLYDFADKNGGKLPIQTFFILDEFANIGQIPDFDKKISTSRSRGISFSVILQNLDQLKSIYEKSYETIIGNCDTHVFLGSNSFATVEYFSKELGEKTITHNSKSINRDNDSVRKGYSESDQIMARALMTPDELRRMDNDECIIFEKGLKPIKAKKYWWFKEPHIVRDLEGNEISHNDYLVENRGEWRKFNPYNPYVEPSSDNEREETKIGSLDDLFEEAPSENNTNKINNENINHMNDVNLNGANKISQNSNLNNMNLNNTNPSNINSNNTNLNNINSNNMNLNNANLNNINSNNMNLNNTNSNNRNLNSINLGNTQNRYNQQEPVSKIEAINQRANQESEQEDDEVDIQKELEAKFDELFGKM